MDRFTMNKLNLHPRSDETLHSVLHNFELKYEARRVQNNERISRYQ